MALHRSPMIIYFKSRGCRVLPVLHGYIPNSPKSDVLTEPHNQVRHWWAKLIRFRLFICRTLQWNHTEALWPFISKVTDAVSCHFCMDIFQIILKSDVLSEPHTQVRSWWAKLIRCHPFKCRALLWHHTEAPGPFISKVVAAGYRQFCTDVYQKTLKVMSYQSRITNCVPGELNWSDSSLLNVGHYYGITQKSPGHLFQKSWVQGIASFARMYTKKP